MADISECKRSTEFAGSTGPSLITLTLPDRRADDRHRKVELTRHRIIIRRTVAGVAMFVQLPATAYRGIALCLSEPIDGGTQFELRLVHGDSELCVRLAHGEEEVPIIEAWRSWLAFFGLPPLLERELGSYVAADSLARLGALGVGTVRPRRRNATLANRRGRFALRRKSGDLDRLTEARAGEREIICYE